MRFVAALAALLFLAASAFAFPFGRTDPPVSNAFAYLRSRQTIAGDISGFDISQWVAMAVAATGENPRSWRYSAGPSLCEYVRDNAWRLNTTRATDLEKFILAATSCGEDPHVFGGRDYVALLLGLQSNDQMGDPLLLTDDFWGVAALASVGLEASTTVQNSIQYILSHQNSDGGWSGSVASGSDPDNTAAALFSLFAADFPLSGPIVAARDYLHTVQQFDGGFGKPFTNVASTAWVVSAINALGEDPSSSNWTRNGTSAVGYILALQDPDGAFRYTSGWRSSPEWMTAYALVALSGKWYPVVIQTDPPSNEPPSVRVLQPSSGESWSGGTNINIIWDMDDSRTPQANLIVYLNFSYTSGGGSITGPLTGLSPPFIHAWTLPLVDSVDVVVTIHVIDAEGARGTNSSSAFEIDSTEPTLTLTRPMSGETGVPMSTDVQADWNEGMNRSATESSFQLFDNSTWLPVSGQARWVGNSFIFDPDIDLSANSWYTANFTTQAKDDSNPGNRLLATYSWSHKTASVSDNTRPKISDARAVPSPQEVHFNVNVSAIATDDFAVGVVTLNTSSPSGTTNVTMTFDVVSGRYYVNASYRLIGLHYFTIWAADTSGNWNSSSGIFLVVDTTPPVIQHTPIASWWRVGNPINLTATVTDDYLLRIARLNYADVSGVVHNVSMASSGQDKYYFVVEAQSIPGTLSYFFWAEDNSGNPAASQVYAMTIVELRLGPPLNLTVSREGFGALRLNWVAPAASDDGSPLADLAGYNIYRMSASGGQRTRVNTVRVTNTTFLDIGLEDGKTYYYVVRAVNSRGLESVDSNEASGATMKLSTANYSWIVLLAILIVATVMAAMFLLFRGRVRDRNEQERHKGPDGELLKRGVR